MIKYISLIIAAIAFSAYAQYKPQIYDWNVTLKVVDDAGQPVADAEARVDYMLTNVISGFTDTNGLFTASHHDGSENMIFQAKKSGYYPFFLRYEVGSKHKPDKWDYRQNIILKKIGKQIGMYAKKEEAKLPKENEPVGFDLTVGDWVAPYGKGITTDLFFAVQRKIVSEREYNADLKLSFPNAGDGVVVLPPVPDTGSPLKMPRIAAESGYESSMVWHYTHTQRPAPVLGYFFRVRTVLDEKGNIQSALYGKIQGNIRFYVGTIAPRAGLGFDYYLNPTPNSRNVEFDPKQNLFMNLSFMEKITAP